VLFFTLVHVVSSIGFSAVSHYCHRSHQQAITTEACCCVDVHMESETTACTVPHSKHLPYVNLRNPSCCEVISHFHKMENTAPVTTGMPILTMAQPAALLPTEKNIHPVIVGLLHQPD